MFFRYLTTTICLLFLLSSAQVKAGDIEEASGTLSFAGLSLIAAPVLSAYGLIALGAATAGGLSELTADTLDASSDAVECLSCDYDNAPRINNVKAGSKHKTIPLVIREDDYIEMNETLEM